ncbi:hypothetical protein [Luteimonas changyuni]|uniref:hypothetical protein n=1 Tax=Luteimonas sp. MJ145 TaxID=3129234 RepID=UPI0031BBA69C
MEGSAAACLAALFGVALATTACAPSADEAATATAPTAPSNATNAKDSAARPTALTDANLDAYGRALAKQAEIIRRPGRGTHYGVTLSIHDLDGETGEVLEAAGMTVDEYRAVEQQVEPVFTILNFKGEIGPPRSIDLEAAPEWKAKLEGDPFATLPPESAAALRRSMDTLVPLWSDVIGLTAQHGR